MKPNWYAIISDCVERGAGFGVRRAYKHTDSPSEDAIVESVNNEVMNAISEVVDWDDGKNE